jgi:integrase
MTIDTLFQQYVELKKAKWTKKTLGNNISAYDKHIYPALGLRNIDTLNFIDYQKFSNNLLDGGLSPKTVKNILIIVSGIIHYAQKTDLYMGKDYVQYVELPDFDNKRYFTLSTELQKKYIHAIMNFNEPVYKDIFLFLLHGRRLNEVLDLKWEFLDLNQGIMYLPASRNKSRKNLSFQMTDKQMNALRKYQLEAHDKQGSAFLKGHVFLNPRTGKKYIDISKAWKRLLSRAVLPKIRIHDIRHLIGTYLLNELNTPIEHVSHLLGHSDIKVTQRYVNPKPANAKNAMDSLFESVKTQGELHVEKLNEAIVLGECIQKTLFPSAKFIEVRSK